MKLPNEISIEFSEHKIDNMHSGPFITDKFLIRGKCSSQPYFYCDIHRHLNQQG